MTTSHETPAHQAPEHVTPAHQAPGRESPLREEHDALGAHFTDFGGWTMPLKYESELAEHRAVRETAGLFDLSHMGEIRIEGPGTGQYLNSVLVGDIARVPVGRAKYSLLCQEDGGIVDDLIVYRLGEQSALVVPNAGNAADVVARFRALAAGHDVEVTDETHDTALIAVQGRKSAAILRDAGADAATVEALRSYAAVRTDAAGVSVLLARTGYTGEDGFELYAERAHAVDLWRSLLAAGAPHGLIAAGLAARDSLRLEAGMPLYGNELGLDVTPFEVGLGGVVSFDKAEDFPGRRALESAGPPERVLVGLQGLGRRAGRPGYAVRTADAAEGRVVGRITSGQPSPTLGHPIALARIDAAFSEVGTRLEIDVRGRAEPVRVTRLPFLRRSD